MDCEICHATLSIERNDFNNEILIKCDECGWETEEKVVKLVDFDCNKVTYGELSKLPGGIINIDVNYEGMPLFLDTPKMENPFGLNRWVGNENTYSLQLSFNGHETNLELKTFLESLQNLERKLIADAMTHSKTWFKKSSLQEDVADDMFNRIVKRRSPRPPLFKVSVPFSGGEFKCHVYNTRTPRTQITMGEVVTSSTVRTLITPTKLWFIPDFGRFGLSWSVREITVIEDCDSDLLGAYSPWSYFDDSDSNSDSDDISECLIVDLFASAAQGNGEATVLLVVSAEKFPRILRSLDAALSAATAEDSDSSTIKDECCSTCMDSF